MSLDEQSLKDQVPHYLTAEDQRVLLAELRSIAGGDKVEYAFNSLSDPFPSDMLQGDGWTSFQLFDFQTGERRPVRGLVLSNSCDIDPANARDTPTKVTFAPLVKLAAFEAVLKSSGISEEKIAEKIKAIKAQKTSNIFYLPSGANIAEDYIVRLDELHSMPMAAHVEVQKRSKLFTLSQTGFYMLVLKLSVHFCRLQEGVQRKPKVA